MAAPISSLAELTPTGSSTAPKTISSPLENGRDTFVFALGFGHDVITDFSPADKIEFGVFRSFRQVQAASQQVGADTVITVDADNSIILEAVKLNDFRAEQVGFVLAGGSGAAVTADDAANNANVGLLGQYVASAFVDQGTGRAGSPAISSEGQVSSQGSMSITHGCF
jgi:hypothetical protein